MKNGILNLALGLVAVAVMGCQVAPEVKAKSAEPKEVVVSNMPDESAEGVSVLSKTVAVGKVAPNFELPDETGKAWKLSDYKGKVVLLDFWGFWCPYCVKELPELRKISDDLKGKDFVMIGINTDDDDLKDIQAKLKKSVVNWRQGMVPGDADIKKDYKVTEFPTKVLIDKDGKIVFIDHFITKAEIEKYL
ncbi:MAG: peroxiredoxin family protein [Fimbriimonadaceae bacterium]